MMTNLDDLPAELFPFKDNILATVKPVIEINLSPADDLPLWTSKVGGKPYLPLNVEYPHDKDGKSLGFLAQFNLEELPKIDALPQTGILSFFINFDCESKVLYFENVITNNHSLQQNFDEYDFEDELPFELGKQFLVNFELNQKPISLYDNHSDSVFQGVGNHLDAETLDKIATHELFSGYGHKLLGYPYFTQDDPRHKETKDYILLFQLDTDDNNEIMWGDSGVGNFFIHPNDLKNKDFSKVIFYWDCC